jgi:hypothetical protein
LGPEPRTSNGGAVYREMHINKGKKRRGLLEDKNEHRTQPGYRRLPLLGVLAAREGSAPYPTRLPKTAVARGCWLLERG